MSSNENLVPSRYEIRLPEGLNYLEYTCQDLDSDRIEVVKFWVDVLPWRSLLLYNSTVPSSLNI